MEILILGGTGFLSSAMARVARDAGHAVTIFTRGKSERPVPDGVTALVGDRKNTEGFRQLVVPKYEFGGCRGLWRLSRRELDRQCRQAAK